MNESASHPWFALALSWIGWLSAHFSFVTGGLSAMVLVATLVATVLQCAISMRRLRGTLLADRLRESQKGTL